MADCIGPTNIIPNNNQVVLVDVNKTITVIDNNCCTTVDVTQPVTSVVQVLTGPIGAKGDTGASGSQGPIGPSGSQGPTGPSGSSQPFSYVSGNIWATTSSLEISGSLTVSGSSTFTNIGLALFSGSTNLSGSGTLNGYPLLTSNNTGSLLLSSSFNQFTSSYYTDSASFNTRILNNSSSIAVLSSSFLSTSSSLSTRVTALENFSSSLNNTFATDAELNAATASLSSSIASLSSSYIASSASFSASIASLTNATSSYVLNSQTSSMTVLSASFASTASLAPNYLPLTGGTINGNVTVNGTASIAFLNVTYESASVIYSSGSNQFGDASNDVQTLWGTVDIKTGPVLVTGSVTATSGFTGSLLGTASSAVTSSYSNFANTASGVLGGSINHVPYFKTNTTFATSSIYQSGSSTVIINQDNATTAAPEALYVYQPSTTSYNVISGKGNLNNYLQLNIQNTNQGTDASSDVVATANNGNETIHYIDMGINSENYSGFLGGANDAYLYSTGHNLWIGNYSDGYKVYFFNSSSLQPIITLNEDNAEVTGSLFGTASWALNAINADNATSASYALTASYASNVPATASFAVSSSYAITASHALNVPVTASYAISSSHANNADNALTATSTSHVLNADNALTANYAATAGNGGVTQLIAGSGITLLPPGGQGAVTIISTGGGGVTIISGSLVTGSFTNTNSYTFNHNLNTRTPIITVFDFNYNQIIPENIQLVDTSSAIITFPTLESGFAIGSTGGTTGTALSSSYALFSTYADTASYYAETDPVFVAKSASLATTGSNIFRGNQTITGSIYHSGSLIQTGSVSITGSTIINNLAYPVADNGEESFIQTDGNGILSLQYVKTIYEEIYNGEATQIIKGTPVYVSGSVGAAAIVYRADAGNPSKMPVVYVSADTIASGGTGRGIALGLIKGVDTTGYPAGTEIYVGVGGGWTSIRPTGSAIVQILGYVTKEGSGGQGVVLNPGPASLPNLPSGSVWVGNSGSIPVAILTSSLSVASASFASTASYVNPLRQNVIITGSLTVSGSNTFTNIGPAVFVGNHTVTGSLSASGSNTLIGNTLLSGSINISGSQTFNGTSTSIGTQIVTGSLLTSGSNTLVGNTTLSGSIEVSGSSNFHNSEFIVTGSTSILGDFNVRGTSVFSNTTFTVTGSQYFTGSSFINGNQSLTGNSAVTGSLDVIGNINVISGSSFTRWGNKLFNYNQFANTSSIFATASVSASFSLPLTYFTDGVNIVSGSQITFVNTGIYNIQYSVLANQGTGVRNLHIWFKKTGSNIDNSATLVQLQNNSQTSINHQFLYPYSASEYAELWYHSDGANTSFPYSAVGGGFPAVPSILVTVTQIA